MATRQEIAEKLHELAVEAATDADREQVNAERRLRTLETTKAKLDDIAEARMAEADAGVEAERALLKELQALRELEAAHGRDTTAIEAGIAASKAHIDVLKLQTKALKKLEGQLKSLRDEGEKFIENALGMDDALVQLGAALDETEGGLKAYAQGMGKALFSKKAMGAGVRKIDKALTAGVMAFAKATLDLALAQDQAVSSFMKATGAGMEYGRVITDSQRETALYGVDVAETGKSVEALYSGMSQFTQLNKSEQKNLTKTVSLLSELGVSAETSSKILDTATRSLGMNAAQSEELLRDIKATADAIGLPAGKLAQDFAAAAPKLTKYGGKMMEVFEGLAVQAKATGLEINQLLGVTEQFDTFEGAGRAVGRLNAILGGPYLNSIDMLNATDEERIEILQRMTEQAGLQFDELGRYEQMAIASAMGTDVDTARRMFGASRAEFEKQAMAQEDLAEQAAKAQTIMDQLKAAFNAALVDMRPFIEDIILPMIAGLRDMAGATGTLQKKLGDFFNSMANWTLGIGLALLALGIVLSFTGVGAAVGLPIAMLGAKMAGLGGGAKYIMSKGSELATQGKEMTMDIAAKNKAKSQALIETQEAAAGGPEIQGLRSGGYVKVDYGRGLPNPRTLKASYSLTGITKPPATALAIVGENGPELGEFPVGGHVTKAPTTERLTVAMEKLSDRLLQASQAAGSAKATGTPTVILEVEGREMAKIVGDSLDSEVLRRKLLVGFT